LVNCDARQKLKFERFVATSAIPCIPVPVLHAAKT
jgi:hypothetical protein